MRLLTCFVLCLMLSLSFSYAQDSKIGEMEQKVERKNKGDDASYDDNDGGSGIGYFFADIIVDGVVFLFFGVNEYSPQLNRYPYFWGDSLSVDGKYTYMGSKSTALETNLHYFSERWQLNGGHLESVFHFSPSFSVEGNYLFMHEQVREGVSNRLHWSGLNVSYHRVRSKKVDAWWGMGVSHLILNEGYTGFMFNAGIAIYPVDPVSLTFQGHWSWMRGWPLSDNEIKATYHFQNLGAYVGYQRFAFAEVPVHSWMLGVSVFL